MITKPESHNKNCSKTWTALTCLWFLWDKVHAGPQVVSIWMLYTDISYFDEDKLISASWKLTFLFSMKESISVLSLCHGALNVCVYKAVSFVSRSVNSEILCDFFTGKLCILQGCAFRDVWTSKYASIKETCSTLKCHIVMASLERVSSLKIAMTFFLVCGFFLYIAAYCTDYKCKWKTEDEIITYAFYNIRR